MKRLFCLLIPVFASFSFIPSAVHAGDCYADPVHQYAGTGSVKSAVFVRDQACMQGSVVMRTLSAGTSVSVIGFTDGWYRVESGGTRGWVGQQFIQTSAERTGTAWSSYNEYMTLYPSQNQTAAPAPSPSPSGETAYTGIIAPRDLIKLVCPANAGADHACKAVYYIGADGKRHAFPNSKVFFTWYANFDAVRAVSAERLSAYTLGANVTYRPGVRMVKFTTEPKTYAVAGGGVLRWVSSEQAARSLYGDDWNTKIDDIADVFYTNYHFGTDVASMNDFVPFAETAAAPTFD